eukprot:COSAG01_NODE_2029_length_8590_cov_5.719501_12_plen_162_part_00
MTEVSPTFLLNSSLNPVIRRGISVMARREGERSALPPSPPILARPMHAQERLTAAAAAAAAARQRGGAQPQQLRVHQRDAGRAQVPARAHRVHVEHVVLSSAVARARADEGGGVSWTGERCSELGATFGSFPVRFRILIIVIRTEDATGRNVWESQSLPWF